jgi:2-haloalkanoic acid dehalogenase type II
VSDFEALTFDCYGTLIDWYAGVRAAASATASFAGIDVERFVRDRDAADRELISGEYRPYAEIVAESARHAGLAQGRSMSAPEGVQFAHSMRTWPPFAESRRALARLGQKYTLGVLSNVDTSTLEASAELLGTKFDLLVTAQQLRSYKPQPAHWQAACEQLGIAPARVLHVGCSLFHDMRPARELGFATAFVNRDAEPLEAGDAPSYVVPDLATLCEQIL